MCLRDCTQAAPTSPRSRSSLSPTPDPNDPVNIEALFQENLRGEHKAYQDLIQDGGQPSHCPDDAGFGILDEPGEYADIISYWTNGWPDKICILSDQWWHWQKFREYQDRIRKRYANPKHFGKFVQYVREYRRDKGLECDIRLLQNRKEQSRLDDWKEFQFREYGKADGFIGDMERAVEDKKRSESRLQAAIDKGQPADEIEWMKQQGVVIHEARRGTAERELKRHAVFLKWIDEQLPIIASECAPSGINSEIGDDRQLSSVSTHLGKRKRAKEDTMDRTASQWKISKPHDVTVRRRKGELEKRPGSPVAPAINTDSQTSKLVDQPQHHIPDRQLRRSERIANSGREETIPSLVATAFRPRGYSTVKNGNTAEKRVDAPSDFQRQASNASRATRRASQPPGPRNRTSGRFRLRERDPMTERSCDNTGLRRSRRVLEKREKLLSSA